MGHNIILSSCVDALQLGSTAIGVLTKEGVVLAVEKRITSPLLVSTVGHSCSKLAAWQFCSPNFQTVVAAVHPTAML